MNSPNYRKYLFILIAISFLIRLVFAHLVELTNDEVNYWTYALFPSLSYFDHSPMVGWLIRASTLNLMFTDELFVRLSSIIIGAVNTYLMFAIGKAIKDELTGIYCALLYNTSVYCVIISGIFIMPDTPQLLFWLLSIYYFLRSIANKEINKTARLSFLYAGIFVGLAMLSKYHSVFLWVGAILFILFYNRAWLKTKELYISIIISFIFFIPVLIWNYQNDFISFTYQSERIDIMRSGFRFDYFITELIGEVFYANPVTYVLILVALLRFKRIVSIDSRIKRFILAFKAA